MTLHSHLCAHAKPYYFSMFNAIFCFNWFLCKNRQVVVNWRRKYTHVLKNPQVFICLFYILQYNKPVLITKKIYCYFIITIGLTFVLSKFYKKCSYLFEPKKICLTKFILDYRDLFILYWGFFFIRQDWHHNPIYHFTHWERNHLNFCMYEWLWNDKTFPSPTYEKCFTI